MSNNTMKALRFAEFGPPSVLRIEEIPIPDPHQGEALVRVRAAAINPSDIGDVAGRFKKTTLPRTPGRDFAGVVVKGKQPEGEEVWGSAPDLGIVHDGSHAEYVVVPAATRLSDCRPRARGATHESARQLGSDPQLGRNPRGRTVSRRALSRQARFANEECH